MADAPSLSKTKIPDSPSPDADIDSNASPKASKDESSEEDHAETQQQKQEEKLVDSADDERSAPNDDGGGGGGDDDDENEAKSNEGGVEVVASTSKTRRATDDRVAEEKKTTTAHSSGRGKKRSRGGGGGGGGSVADPSSGDVALVRALTFVLADVRAEHHGAALSAAHHPPSSAAAHGHDAVGGTRPSLPSVEQARAAAARSVHDCPPWAHLSSRDSAPQLRVNDSPTDLDGRRLSVEAGPAARGYRAARAAHGVSEGNWYYEVVLRETATAEEILRGLPRHARLGRGLRRELEEKIRRERAAAEAARDDAAVVAAPAQAMLGGHVRLGWSTRSGDLQAPVGYDRWSYAIRDKSSSRVHDSKRDDAWAGGVDLVPGDVVGCAISLTKTGETGGSDGNHVRFFRNGRSLGQILVSRNVRSGGAAFRDVESGTYYPAVSVYMGGRASVNLGPRFVYPVQPNQLSSDFGARLRPACEACPAPPTPETVLEWARRERDRVCGTSGADAEASRRFEAVVRAEAEVRYEAYEAHSRAHAEFVERERRKRGLSVNSSSSNNNNNNSI